ncbi:uncharacterized protein [Montipora capricornis]|uniref:uncharacterized protein isoform X1 n=1 Tax=Montipora capricornis TaxID=246305 RepID=UPI0035F1F997
MKDLEAKYHTPENCPNLCVPKVNPVLWHDLPRSSKTKDLGLQEVQRGIVKATQPILTLLEDALVALKVQEKIEPSTFVSKLSDSVTFMCHASYKTSMTRRETLEDVINSNYKQSKEAVFFKLRRAIPLSLQKGKPSEFQVLEHNNKVTTEATLTHLNKSVIETSEGQCPAISSDCTNLANTDLVPGFTDSVSDETYPPTSHEQSTLPSEQANSSSYGKEASPCRLDLISQHLRERGVSEQAAQLVCSSWSKGTEKQYRPAWQKWCSWCSKEQIEPLQATPAQVANFLSVEFGANKSYSTLNLYRSAISSTLHVIEENKIGEHPIVSRCIKVSWCSWLHNGAISGYNNQNAVTLPLGRYILLRVLLSILKEK